MVKFVKTDGGKGDYRCTVEDCAIRAVAIALDIPFEETDRRHRYTRGRSGREIPFEETDRRGRSGREINRRFVGDVMDANGWEWFPSTAKMSELPSGTILVRSIEHYAVFKDGVLYDAYDCTEKGERRICEYWRNDEKNNR